MHSPHLNGWFYSCEMTRPEILRPFDFWSGFSVAIKKQDSFDRFSNDYNKMAAKMVKY
jgi:hypothetical protein